MRDEDQYQSRDPGLAAFYEPPGETVHYFDERRYGEETFIAEGAIKHVSRTFDHHCQREVAIARIRQSKLTRGTALGFVHEVQLAAALEHPNIVRIYDVGIREDQPYFTMELISGHTLDQWLTRNPNASERQKLELFTQLCNAVSYAHERDVLHLDLKPANIHVNEQANITLTDWGISHYLSKTPEHDLLQEHTSHGRVKGTPGFMAPEQITQHEEKTVRTDVFGLGAILFYLLTGKAPFDESDFRSLNQQIRDGNLAEPDTPAPGGLLAVIRKSLSYSPSARYQNVHDLQKEVAQYQDGYPTHAEQASFERHLMLFLRRNAIVSLLVAFFGILLVLSTTIYIARIKHNETIALAERDKARQATLQAQQAQQESEEHLQNLLREKQLTEELDQTIETALSYSARYYELNLDFDAALIAAQRAHKKKPDSRSAAFRLAYIHFIRHEFEEFLYCMQHYPTAGNNQDLVALAHKYATSGTRLDADTLIALFKEIAPHRRDLPLLMLSYNARLAPPGEQAKIIRYFLMRDNHLEDMNFDYNAGTRTLDLSNNPRLKHLFYLKGGDIQGYLLLSSLPIKTLVLTNTAVSSEEIIFLQSRKPMKVIR